jgi:hypothetical protein
MIDPAIVDAGPALNFFSINKERLLFDAIGKIAVPETVAGEIAGKAQGDARFRAAADVLAKLSKTDWLRVPSDEVTPDLAAAVLRITAVPMAERMTQAKDLGEIMVVAHAAVQADTGRDVSVLIDDGRGAQLAAIEAARLRRLRGQGRDVGSLSLLNTLLVLERAAGRRYLPDRPSMRRVYDQLRHCDDGLVDIKQTDLLSKRVWAVGDPQAGPGDRGVVRGLAIWRDDQLDAVAGIPRSSSCTSGTCGGRHRGCSAAHWRCGFRRASRRYRGEDRR